MRVYKAIITYWCRLRGEYCGDCRTQSEDAPYCRKCGTYDNWKKSGLSMKEYAFKYRGEQ